MQDEDFLEALRDTDVRNDVGLFMSGAKQSDLYKSELDASRSNSDESLVKRRFSSVLSSEL